MVEAQSEEQRLAALFAPLIQDKMAWEATFTEEEKAEGAKFEQELKDQPEKLQAFMAEIDAAFTGADADSDGQLSRDEFKTFVTTMNANGVARGLKNRDTTDEFIDLVYPCFKAFNLETDGVTKIEILTILNKINNQ